MDTLAGAWHLIIAFWSTANCLSLIEMKSSFFCFILRMNTGKWYSSEFFKKFVIPVFHLSYTSDFVSVDRQKKGNGMYFGVHVGFPQTVANSGIPP
ncbi:hypothetical protein L596_025166 [Steinernema carpocapsae]|uniref:Secreted protein n=1 Tax=Steinernema carpocapsae TaxID=34508 RepID=A0A4U5M712_STECR|nr:hypothetical protein L596_025166 [Steinernema carpocapsae]